MGVWGERVIFAMEKFGTPYGRFTRLAERNRLRVRKAKVAVAEASYPFHSSFQVCWQRFGNKL